MAVPPGRDCHGQSSAAVPSNYVGPEGGQVLVDETVKAIGGLWPK